MLVASYGLLQFLTAPVLGSLSDRYGRRPVLLLSLTFLGLDHLLYATAGTVWLILVGRVLAGMFAGTYTVVGAYLADVTAADERARAYGFVSAAFSLGFVAGPALGGVLGEIDLRLPFVLAACPVLVNVLYGLLVLPESLPRAARQPFTLRSANPVTAGPLRGRDRRVRRRVRRSARSPPACAGRVCSGVCTCWTGSPCGPAGAPAFETGIER